MTHIEPLPPLILSVTGASAGHHARKPHEPAEVRRREAKAAVGRALLLSALLVAIFCAPCLALEPQAPAVADGLTLLPAGSVQWTGPIGAAIQTSIDGRIRHADLSMLLGPFQSRPEAGLWQCEFWGKWFTSAALAYRYQPTPELRTVLDNAITGLLATQTPDGYLGTYKRSAELTGWDVWGRKYVLLGLLAYYDVTGERKALDAAARAADYTIGQIGPGKADIVKSGEWKGLAPCSILEPIVLLYRRTGEKRYLDFAQYIVTRWGQPGGPNLIRKAVDGVPVFHMFPGPAAVIKDYGDNGQSKAYEMMSCYEGLTELYRATGKPEYRAAVERVYHDIDTTEMTILGTGSDWERWCNGHVRQTETMHEWMETCVTATWIKFSAQLLRLTGDSAYADRIERSAYNSLLGAQRGDGAWWSHISPLNGTRLPAPEQCGIHANCCVASGPRALMLLPALAVMKDSAGPVVQFYEAGTIRVPLASGKQVQLKLSGDYPRHKDVDILVQPEAAEAFTLSLRIPEWSWQTKVEVNGQPVAGIEPGRYARLAREWKPGDRVRVTFDLTTHVVREPGGSSQVAIMRGPIVLAIDKRITPLHPGITKAVVKADPQAVVHAVEVCEGLPKGIRLAMDVPFVAADGQTVLVRMCDYASAGRTWSEESALRVWLPQPLNLEKPFSP